MEEIISFISRMKLAGQQAECNLTVFSLIAPDGDSPDFPTLEKAFDEGSVMTINSNII